MPDASHTPFMCPSPSHNLMHALASVGEVRSGPVPGHFCQTGDPTIPSLTQFLGPGPGLPRTVYIGLVPVQTGSRWSLHYLFIYYSRLRMVGSCGTVRRPAAVSEPSAQRRTCIIAPTRAVALRGANGVWMWMNGGAVVLRNVARWVIRVCWPA